MKQLFLLFAFAPIMSTEVPLNPRDKKVGEFSWGFSPKTKCTRKKFLENRLVHFGMSKDAIDRFYSVKGDEVIYWNLRGRNDLPVMIEYSK